MSCIQGVSKETYDSGDSYPICKECGYVSTYGKCPYMAKPDIYSKMSEKELITELKDAENELFG